MSNKPKACVFIINHGSETNINSPQIDKLISQGNTSLLVLRNETAESDLGLFNTISGLS